MATTAGILSLRGVAKRFQGLVALDGVDLDLPEGGAIGLIGPNGSGKTTLFNVITGLYRPDAGTVRYDGTDITGLASHAVIRRGIQRTFQNLRLFERMTVYENVRASRHAAAPGASYLWQDRARRRAEREEVMALLELVGLTGRADELPGTLPLAGQRRLELARALAPSPRLLLLDEPVGGMTPAETAEMAELIRNHAMAGRSVILIEHKIDMISRLCGRLYVLNFGRKIAEGNTPEVLDDREVLEAYLGVGSEAGPARHAVD